MIKLAASNGGHKYDVWINPAQVRHIHAASVDQVRIVFEKEHSIIVAGTLDEVAAALCKQ